VSDKANQYYFFFITKQLYIFIEQKIGEKGNITAVITQTDLLLAFIEPFLKGETPKGFFDTGN